MASVGSIRPGSAAAWWLAARPATLPLSLAPVALGAAAAARAGAARPGAVALAATVALALQVAANLANDAADHERGADRVRAGPPRAAASGLLSPGALRAGAAAALLVAAAAGVRLLVGLGATPLALALGALGAAALVAAVAYTDGPWPYGYRALGDAAVWLFFGPVAVAGTAIAAHGGTCGIAPWVLGAIAGVAPTVVLAVNNLRDLEGDAAAGKRTLAVLLGPRGARRYLAALPAGAGAALVAAVLAGVLPVAALAALAVAPGYAALVRDAGRARGAALAPLLPRAVRLAVAFELLLAAALVAPEVPRP